MYNNDYVLRKYFQIEVQKLESGNLLISHGKNPLNLSGNRNTQQDNVMIKLNYQ
jgi:hypothetical protein